MCMVPITSYIEHYVLGHVNDSFLYCAVLGGILGGIDVRCEIYLLGLQVDWGLNLVASINES